MARKYPRFLLSNPANTKSTGPFVIHTLSPQFIAKPEFDEKRNLVNTTLVDVWSKDYLAIDVWNTMKEITEWFKHSGRFQSNNEDDQLIVSVSKLKFLLDLKNHFTTEEARELIKILFPTKSKTIHRNHSSYGLKHLFESVSSYLHGDRNGSSKYCSNNTIIEAFKLEGYTIEYDGTPNPNMNLSGKEVNRAYRIFR